MDTAWMSQEVGKWLGSMGYNLLINGICWGYNPLTNPLLSFTNFLGHPSGVPFNEEHSLDLLESYNPHWQGLKSLPWMKIPTWAWQYPLQNPSVSCFRIKPNHLKNESNAAISMLGVFVRKLPQGLQWNYPWSKKPKSFVDQPLYLTLVRSSQGTHLNW